jgi:hypothetical protein
MDCNKTRNLKNSSTRPKGLWGMRLLARSSPTHVAYWTVLAGIPHRAVVKAAR